MTEPATSQGSAPKLADSIVELGKVAFDPSSDAESRERGLVEYEKLIEK